jgi:hypothetical protein
MFDALVSDGWVALAAAAVLVAEIAFARRIAGGGAPAFVANALSGLALIIALWAALAGIGAVTVVAALTASLFAHLVYLVRAFGAR